MNFREQTQALIERVAKAIRWGRFEASLTESELAMVEPTFWEDMPEWQRDDYRIMAKHAVAVMVADVARRTVDTSINTDPTKCTFCGNPRNGAACQMSHP